MTGGDVVMSTTAEAVQIYGRVASGGTKVAPASGSGKWTVTSGSTGVYTIVFTESYAEFLGVNVTLEAARGFYQMDSWTASTRTMVIKTFNTSNSATAIAFSFTATFTESKAP